MALHCFLRRVSRHVQRRSNAHALSTAQSFELIKSGLDSEWTSAFQDAIKGIDGTMAFEDSARLLREITQTNLLRASDLGANPERFFEAHRLLAQHTVEHGPGFWIRFTVHYNLCMGTVMAVGTDDQVAALDDYQKAGQLGCFSLTEKLAGVQSGLVVETTATYDDRDGGSFVLHTPHDGARKNWISQGFVADKTVVLADLIVKGQSAGPHAFIMDLRQDGQLVDGVTVADMGRKTVGNDLDNAWIAFDQVRLPKSALLSKHADVVNGDYQLLTPGVRPFDLIGQRLYTGRVAVAQAALEYRKILFQKAQAYTDAKRTYARDPHDMPVLSEVPQLKALYAENAAKMAEIEAFLTACEADLCASLRAGAVPSSELVDAIATAKVLAVEDSIAACFRLKQEVGSFALMHDAGFKHLDFLQCCKFAEGDSRILMQKMARDSFKNFMKKDGAGMDSNEAAQCQALASGVETQMAKGLKQSEAWSEEWRAVYSLAEAVMARVQRNYVKTK